MNGSVACCVVEGPLPYTWLAPIATLAPSLTLLLPSVTARLRL